MTGGREGRVGEGQVGGGVSEEGRGEWGGEG